MIVAYEMKRVYSEALIFARFVRKIQAVRRDGTGLGFSVPSRGRNGTKLLFIVPRL